MNGNSWESSLRSMLTIVSIEVKSAYTTSEAATILSVSPATIRVMCEQWEPGQHCQHALECYRVGKGDRRIPFHALVEYLSANNEWERENGHP